MTASTRPCGSRGRPTTSGGRPPTPPMRKPLSLAPWYAAASSASRSWIASWQMRPSSVSRSSDSFRVLAARVSASWRAMRSSCDCSVRSCARAAPAALANTSPRSSEPPKQLHGGAPASSRTSEPTATSDPLPGASILGASVASSCWAWSSFSGCRLSRPATRSASGASSATSWLVFGSGAGAGVAVAVATRTRRSASSSRSSSAAGTPKKRAASATTAPSMVAASRASPGASRCVTARTASAGLQVFGSNRRPHLAYRRIAASLYTGAQRRAPGVPSPGEVAEWLKALAC